MIQTEIQSYNNTQEQENNKLADSKKRLGFV